MGIRKEMKNKKNFIYLKSMKTPSIKKVIYEY